MAVVGPNEHPSAEPVHYTGLPVRKTQSTRDEATRILDWNYGVASATPSASDPLTPPHASSRTQRRASMPPSSTIQPYPVHLNHTHADAGAERSPPANRHDDVRRDSENSISTSTVIGALLGAAAGAALTYGFVSDQRGRATSQEVRAPPALARRATYPEHRHIDDSRSQYSHRSDDRTVVCKRLSSTTRYPDVEEDWRAAWGSPKWMTHSKYPPSASRSALIAPRWSHEAGGEREARSRPESRAPRSRVGAPRSVSASPRERAPSVGDGWDRRSHASGDVATRRSEYGPHREQRVNGFRYGPPSREEDSFVSARTHRTSSSTQRPPAARSRNEAPHRSNTGGRVSGAAERLAASPASRLGSRRSRWEDDVGSLAPSDSISCVGSKTSRPRHRH